MEVAQDIVQHTFGVLVLLWVLGYTMLRTQEAWTRLRGEPDDESGPPAGKGRKGDEGAKRRGTFAYAQKRRDDGKWADPPFWALVGGFNALRQAVTGRPRRTERGDEESTTRKDRRWRGSQPGDEQGGRSHKSRRERPEGQRRWQPYDEDLPGGGSQHSRDEDQTGPYTGTRDEDPSARRWRRGRRDEHDDRPETPDITVEEVPRYGPRDPELEPPLRALDPAEEDTGSEPEPVLAEVIRIDTRERTPQMNPGTVAAIGGGNGIAISNGNGQVAVGELNSHEVAMAAASAIVRANGVCVAGMGEVIAILNREIQVVQQKIDALQNNGIKGSVLAKWTDQLAALVAARATALKAQAEIAEAAALAAAARTHQATKGDPVQEAVTASGKPNVADKTSYYSG